LAILNVHRTFLESYQYMKKNTVHILLLLSVCFALYGCGTKGPLYIPEKEYPQPTPASK